LTVIVENPLFSVEVLDLETINGSLQAAILESLLEDDLFDFIEIGLWEINGDPESLVEFPVIVVEAAM
jgi:hypothetical protein